MSRLAFGCLLIAFATVAAAAPSPVRAGVVVIAHPSVKVEGLSKNEVRQLFMGRTVSLPDGTVATLLDLDESVPARAGFLKDVMGKTEQQMRGYWTRLIFTGRAQPPKVMPSAADVVRTVSTAPGYIGYVDSADAARANVRILYRAD